MNINTTDNNAEYKAQGLRMKDVLTWLYHDKNRNSKYATILQKLHKLHTCRFDMYVLFSDANAITDYFFVQVEN